MYFEALFVQRALWSDRFLKFNSLKVTPALKLYLLIIYRFTLATTSAIPVTADSSVNKLV